MFHHLHASTFRTPVRTILGGIPAECVMVLGYYLYEAGMMVVGGSSFAAALSATAAGVPFNIVQGAVGVILSVVLLPVLARASGELDARIRA